MKELATPKAFPNKKFYLKKEEPGRVAAKILIETTSDSSGILKFNLAPGKYFIVDDLKKDSVAYFALLKKYKEGSSYYTPIDKECLKTWIETPELIIEVTKEGIKEFGINYYNDCTWNRIPCVHYLGTLPP
ncbi:MAG: hypothetical protein IAF38_07540 [Bacteroidia bacterium]|nr:hypothetical protein [Bacteroidia bacterium]